MPNDTIQPHDEFSFSDGTATAQVVLPPISEWTGPSQRHIAAPTDDWAIKAEQSGFRETADLAETLTWLERLAATWRHASLRSIGKSAGGRDIPMLIVSRFGFEPAPVRSSGKAVVLIQAGIHAGEIDGKDATMMLLRDLRAGKLGDLLDHSVLLFVPILNVDGFSCFGPYSRMNQRGPRQVGRHTNDQNLNLNRDFGKLDAPETRALVALLNAWAPDLYIDTHVTDGVDYRYDVTFGHTAGRHGWSPEISSWIDQHLLPDAVAALEKEGHTPGPLILSVNDRNLRDGRFDFCANARFTTGYASLRHIPAILIENHSLKTYRRRLLGLYVLLASLIDGVSRNVGGLRAAARRDREARRATVPLGWTVTAENPKLGAFKGVRCVPATFGWSGEEVTRWTGEPDDSPVAIVPMTEPSASIRRPRAYYVPPHLGDIVERLRRHGILVEEITAAFPLRATRTHLDEAQVVGDRREAGIVGTSTAQVLEGHVRVDAGKVRRGSPRPSRSTVGRLGHRASRSRVSRFLFSMGVHVVGIPRGGEQRALCPGAVGPSNAGRQRRIARCLRAQTGNRPGLCGQRRETPFMACAANAVCRRALARLSDCERGRRDRTHRSRTIVDSRASWGVFAVNPDLALLSAHARITIRAGAFYEISSS
jgi:hypothetical protein